MPHISFAMAGLILSLVGIALNLHIIIIYYKRKVIQSKNTNLLLMNQAMVDLVNCLVYISFGSIFLISLYANAYRTYEQFFYPYYAANSFHHLSYISSLLTFTLLASERCFAVVFPIIHLVHATPFRIKTIMAFVWIISGGVTTTILTNMCFFKGTLYQGIVLIETYLFIILIAVVTTLFGVTFYKALMSLRINRKQSVKGEMHWRRKELHLLAVLILMYTIFLLPFIPKVVSFYQFIQGKFVRDDLKIGIMLILFCTASICDPLLIMFLKEDFESNSFCKGRKKIARSKMQNETLTVDEDKS